MCPPETKVEYFFRRGTDPQPFSDEWEPYRPIGSGASLDFTLGGADLNRRYVQFKACSPRKIRSKARSSRSATLRAEL